MPRLAHCMSFKQITKGKNGGKMDFVPSEPAERKKKQKKKKTAIDRATVLVLFVCRIN